MSTPTRACTIPTTAFSPLLRQHNNIFSPPRHPRTNPTHLLLRLPNRCRADLLPPRLLATAHATPPRSPGGPVFRQLLPRS